MTLFIQIGSEGFVLLALFGVCLLLVFGFYALKLLLLIRRTEKWPQVEGHVETTHVQWLESGKARGEVGYSYRVGDRWYSGYESQLFPDEQQASDFANRVKGRKLLVHHHPRKPKKAVIWRAA
jgi:Protein of unknown function (DUF3592)